MSSRPILIIAYHFPPDADVGALRPQKFVKYLREKGWSLHVLTIRQKHIEICDESRLVDVTDFNVVRTTFWRTPLQLCIDIRDRLYRPRAETFKKHTTPNHPKNTHQESLLQRLKRYFVALNWFPDDKLWWTIPSIFSGFFLIRRERISLILATSPPPTDAIIGYILSQLTGAHLVIDLRDPWVAGRRTPLTKYHWPLLKQLEESLERIILKRAHHIICNTDYFKRKLQENYPELGDTKFSTIPNGYDTDEFQLVKIKHNSQYVITYLGTFYMERSPNVFFQALQKLVIDKIIPLESIEVRLIGQVEYAEGISVREMAVKYGLVNQIKIMRTIPHNQAILQMAEADLLLLLAPNQPYQIPAKAFEYIGVRRPILALTGQGATADLINSVKAGLCAAPDKVDEVADALGQLYLSHRDKRMCWYSGEDVRKYHRKHLSHELSTVLKGIDAS